MAYTFKLPGVHSTKFQKKYMSLAKAIAQDNDACYSRKLGVVIVSPNHRVRGIGYNGPPRGTPHTDDESYLDKYFWPMLTDDDIGSLGLMYGITDPEIIKKKFIEQYKDQQRCPRQILGCKSGERSLLCSCVHAEANAIANSDDVTNCVMYCSTPIPCLQCTGLIINSGIIEVHCYNDIYHEQSMWLFKKSNVLVFTYEV